MESYDDYIMHWKVLEGSNYGLVHNTLLSVMLL